MNIFIVGTPRSGTTLIQQIVYSNFNIVSFPETHFFSKLNRGVFKGIFKPNKRVAFNSALSILSEASGVVLDTPKKSFINKRDSINLFITTLDTISSNLKVDACLEKTPMHLHYIKEIKNADQSALFIHVVRKPYDNLRSFYKASNNNPHLWSGSRSWGSLFSRYKKDIVLHHKYLNDERHFFVDYDYFINKQDVVIDSLSQFLKLPITPREVDLKKIIEKDEVWKLNNFNKVGTKSVDDSRVDGELTQNDFDTEYRELNDLYLSLFETIYS